MKATLQHFFFLFWVLFLAFQGHAGTVLNGIDAEPESGVEVEVSTVFEHALPEGTLPMRVRISNGTASDGIWRFRFSGRQRASIATNAVFNVKAGESRIFPISPLLEEGSPLPPRVLISGPAMVGGEATIPLVQRRPGSYEKLPLAGLSRSLAGPSLERFSNRERTGNASDRFGVTRFEAPDLPEAWVGLTGLEWLLLTEAEWTGLKPEVRTAIRRWVAFGGELVVTSRDPAACNWTGTFPLSKGPVSAKGPHAYGSGRFRAVAWDGSPVGVEALDALVASAQQLSREPALTEWPLLKELGAPGSHHLFVACFVVVFATLVGPVNLFWIAPAGRRHRLFFTTPLLSLGGTFILLLVMYVTDGTGGSGSRLTAIELLPEAGEALVTQDQVARTGLLLSSRFTLSEEALLRPLEIPGTVSLEKEIAGRSYSGGWFRSRSLQAHRLATFRPLRAAVRQVERSPSGAPVIVSGLDNPIGMLLFRDADASLWKGVAIQRGEPTPLLPVTKARQREALQEWRTVMADALPNRHLPRLTEKPLPDPGCFYATLANAAGQPVETLDSIRWEDHAVVFGPVEGVSPAPLPEGRVR